MNTKEIPIDWEGKPAKVEIKKMGFIDKKKFQASFIKNVIDIDPATGKERTSTEIDIFEAEIQGLKRFIIKAPFDWKTDEGLNEVPPETGEKIWNEIKDFNKIDIKKKERSDGSSVAKGKTEQPTTQK
jgi:hypothetical protein